LGNPKLVIESFPGPLTEALNDLVIIERKGKAGNQKSVNRHAPIANYKGFRPNRQISKSDHQEIAIHSIANHSISQSPSGNCPWLIGSLCRLHSAMFALCSPKMGFLGRLGRKIIDL
jgi:hypothetical protein